MRPRRHPNPECRSITSQWIFAAQLIEGCFQVFAVTHFRTHHTIVDPDFIGSTNSGAQSLMHRHLITEIHALNAGLRKKLRKLAADRQTEELAYAVIHLLRSPHFSVQRVARNMRRTECAVIQQLAIQLRLIFPDIENGAEIFMRAQMLKQRFVVHYSTAGGVDQAGVIFHLIQSSFIDQMPGRMLPFFFERGVQRHDVSLQHLLKRGQLTNVFFIALP